MRGILKGLRTDLRSDFGSSWWKYLAAFALSFFSADAFFKRCGTLAAVKEIKGVPTIFDCIFYIFRGMKEYIPENGKDLELSFMFMAMIFILAITVGEYPVKDIHGFGMQMLIRNNSKTSWWIGKCLWVTSAVLGFYICIYAGILLSAVFHDCLWIPGFNPDVMKKVCGSGELTPDPGIIWAMILLPVIASLAISLLQLFIVLVTNPVIGFGCIVVLYAVSAYFMNWMLIGNHIMAFRFGFITGQGIPLWQSVALDIAVAAAAACAGAFYFKRKDIINSGGVLGGI